MNGHNSLRTASRLINLAIIAALLLAPIGGALAAPPPPNSTDPATSSTQPPSPEPGVLQAPVPGNLPAEVEEARARAAMEATLSKFLDSLGPQYDAALTVVKVEGMWGYGAANWLSDHRLFDEPIYMLAHHLPGYSWQVLMPSTEGLFPNWLVTLPVNLLSEDTKKSIRAEAQVELRASDRSSPTPNPTPRPSLPESTAASDENSALTFPPNTASGEPTNGASNNQRTIVSTNTIVQDGLAKYSHLQYGFSLQYPSTWSFEEFNWQNSESQKFDFLLRFKTTDNEMLSILVWEGVHSTSSTQWTNEILKPILPPESYLGVEDGLVSNQPSTVLVARGNPQSPSVLYVHTIHNGLGYRIQYTASQSGLSLEEVIQTIRSIDLGEMNSSGSSEDIVQLPDLSLELFSPKDFQPETDYEHCGENDEYWDPTYNRFVCGQCTWWAAFSRPDIPATEDEWRHNGSGDASLWDDIADQHPRFTVTDIPESGAIAVWDANGQNHVAYVTSVHSDGTFDVTEMNYPPCQAINKDMCHRYGLPRQGVKFIPGGVTVFYEPYFGGRQQPASPDWIRLTSSYPNILYTGTSSIFIPSEWDMIAFSDAQYSGGWRERYGTDALTSSFYDLSQDNFSDGTNMNNRIASIKVAYRACLDLPGQATGIDNPQSECQPPPPPNDTTPPSASGFAASSSGATANLSASGVQDNPGGSGVREVRFSAKWSGTWRDIGVDTSDPYSLDWDMCTRDVPNGDIELGMEVWDNAGIKWVWSEHYANPHISKNHNCAPPPPQEGVNLYRNTGQAGEPCYFTQDAPSIGNYCQSAGSGSGWNDDAESVRVQGPYYFALYRDDNYSGGEPLTGNPTGDLPTEWRNQASSIRIRRNDPARFTLYDLGDYNGQSFASDRTIYDFGHWAFNDRAESIRVAAGHEVIVCADADLHGICGRTTTAAVSDINAVAQGLRNAVSSVRVCAGSCPPAPDAPNLHSPLDGSTIPANESILYQWSGNGDQYNVEWWGGTLPGVRSSGWRSGTQWSTGVLAVSNNPYYWRVRAWNAYGESSWSGTKSFYVKQPQPDLHPYAPPGYQSPIVPSSVRGTYASNTLYAGQSTYFGWHFTNTGTGDAVGSFYVELWVDGTRYVRYPHSDFGRFQVGGFDDWQETISATGWHTVRLIVDPDNTIVESDETNNIWEGQYYWSPINGWWGEYYNNQTLLGFPVLVRDDAEVNFEWYGNSPDPSVPEDHFSARWTRTIYFSSGTYQFHILRDDGARLWVDNNMILDAWQNGREEHFVDYTMDSGYHVVRMEMYENDGWARSGLSWQASDCNDINEPNGSPGLATTISYGQSINAMICPAGDQDYYSFSGNTGDKIVVDIDATINASALDSYVYIVDSDGSTVVAENDDERPGLYDSKLGYELPHPGTYYVRVQAFGHPNVGGNGYFYTMHLFADDQSPTSTAITSPSNDAWIDPSWQNIVAVGSDSGSGINRIEFLWHDSNWANPDWVWLGADSNGNDGWSLTFQTANQADQRGGAFYILAFDWVGNWAGAAVWNLGIDRTPPSPSVLTAPLYGNAPFRDFWVDWSASTDNLSGIDISDVQYRDNGGVWTDLWNNTTLLVDRFVGEVGHSYDFRARARDVAGNQSDYVATAAPYTVEVCPVAPDSFEPDNTAANAGWITINGTAQSHNIHVEQDADWVKFSATAGVLYSLATSNPGGHADTQLWLYGTDGSTLLASNDDYPGMGLSSRIDWQPTASGVYYAKVDHFDQWAYGCTTQYGVSITTTCNLVGDVNNDGVVNVLDIQEVANRWGATAGSPNYGLQFDLNSDGNINIVDVMIVSQNWGSSC